MFFIIPYLLILMGGLTLYNVNRMSLIMNERVIGQAVIQVASGDSLICFIPFIYFIKKNELKLALFLCFILGAFISLKRSVLAIWCINLLFFFIFDYFKTLSFKQRIISLAGGIVIILLFSTYYGNFIEDSHIWNRIREEGTNRDSLFTKSWNYITKLSFEEYFFGKGYKSLQILTKGKYTSTHNDFLEIILDGGIFPLIAYIYFLISMIERCWKERKNYHFRLGYISIILCLLCINMFICFFIHTFFFPALYFIIGIYAISHDSIKERKLKTTKSYTINEYSNHRYRLRRSSIRYMFCRNGRKCHLRRRKQR